MPKIVKKKIKKPVNNEEDLPNHKEATTSSSLNSSSSDSGSDSQQHNVNKKSKTNKKLQKLKYEMANDDIGNKVILPQPQSDEEQQAVGYLLNKEKQDKKRQTLEEQKEAIKDPEQAETQWDMEAAIKGKDVTKSGKDKKTLKKNENGKHDSTSVRQDGCPKCRDNEKYNKTGKRRGNKEQSLSADGQTPDLITVVPKPQPFDINIIKPDYTVVLNGKRGTGKSYFMRWCMFNMRHFFPEGLVMTRTKHNGFVFQFSIVVV